MIKLGGMSQEIKVLQGNSEPNTEKIQALKRVKKESSVSLQRQMFDSYHFLNSGGQTKTQWEIDDYATHKMPPSGAGECAAPKLFQYAFTYQLKPLAIAEFWWGKATKSENQQHTQFYPACHEKCGPLLNFMLKEVE